jgi:hypothetical protein
VLGEQVCYLCCWTIDQAASNQHHALKSLWQNTPC